MTLAPLRPIALPALLAALAMAAITVTVAVAASAFGWVAADSSTDELLRSITTVLIIASVNLLQAGTPIIVAAIAAGMRGTISRRIWRGLGWALIVFLPLKSAIVIGIVGATDLSWLAGASRWWVFEYLALGVGVATAAATLRARDPLAAVPLIRLAGVIVVVTLLLGATLETYAS